MPIFNLLPTYGLVADIEESKADLLPTYGIVLGTTVVEEPPPPAGNPPIITLVT